MNQTKPPETKEKRELRLEKRELAIDQENKRHDKIMKLIKSEDWKALKKLTMEKECANSHG